jgi:hypothetical protein
MPRVRSPKSVRDALTSLDRAIAATVLGLAGVFSGLVIVNLPIH